MKIERLECIEPRGFCFGVKRALDLLTKSVKYSPYVLHEIVHNMQVVNSYKEKGVRFVSSLSEIPNSATCVFSAHGVNQRTVKEAQEKSLKIIDTTCPFVQRMHKMAQKFSEENRTIILIGDKKHDEIIGTMGQVKNGISVFVISSPTEVGELPEGKVGVLTQTTWSQSELDPILQKLKEKYQDMKICSGICKATTERQEAVKKACTWADTVIVVGDVKSSNANRLKNIAQNENKVSYLVATEQELKGLKLGKKIAITAAASTPEEIVSHVYQALKQNTREC